MIDMLYRAALLDRSDREGAACKWPQHSAAAAGVAAAPP